MAFTGRTSSILQRLLFRGVYWRVPAYLGVGYGCGIAADRGTNPISYFPWGICRTYEAISEAVPALRNNRLALYEKASRASQRWRVESPFLNGYLLDRICREVLENRTLGGRSVQTSPADTNPQQCPLKPLRRVAPQASPISHPFESQGSAGSGSSSATAGRLSIVSSSITPLPSDVASLAADGQASDSLTQPDGVSDGDGVSVDKKAVASEDVVGGKHAAGERQEKAEKSKEMIRTNENTPNATSLIESRSLAFPQFFKKGSPSYASVMDRVHHLTLELDPYCSTIETIAAVYTPVSKMLHYLTSDQNVLTLMARGGRLENDRSILQLLHACLTVTQRAGYWAEYERTAVTPPPPPPLPSIVSPFNPSSIPWAPSIATDAKDSNSASSLEDAITKRMQKEKRVKKSISNKSSSYYDAPSSLNSQRHMQWDSQAEALNCRRKMFSVWRHLSDHRAFREAANRTVWMADWCSPPVSEDGDRSAPRSRSALLVRRAYQQSVTECIGIAAAIRNLVGDFNRSSQRDRDLSVLLNRTMRTPLGLKGRFHDEAGGPAHRVWRWLTEWPVLPVLAALGVSAVYVYGDEISRSAYVSSTAAILPSSVTNTLRSIFRTVFGNGTSQGSARHQQQQQNSAYAPDPSQPLLLQHLNEPTAALAADAGGVLIDPSVFSASSGSASLLPQADHFGIPPHVISGFHQGASAAQPYIDPSILSDLQNQQTMGRYMEGMADAYQNSGGPMDGLRF